MHFIYKIYGAHNDFFLSVRKISLVKATEVQCTLASDNLLYGSRKAIKLHKNHAYLILVGECWGQMT